jgi:hypothetical protein
MPSLVDTLFGGTDKSALKSQKTSNLQLRDIISGGAAGARQDVLGLFPSAEGARTAGFQGALDVLGQTIPQQFDVFQQGNVGAQSALLAGLPQFNNAILGLPLDLSTLQPQTIGFDTSFAQQQLPQIPGVSTLLGGGAGPTGPTGPRRPFDFRSALAGGF